MEQQTLSQRLASEVDASKAALDDLGPSAAIFGGARVKPGTPYYKSAFETARLLSSHGIAIVTGGGPGIMQAANEGAKAGGNGTSVGLTIRLPFEEAANPNLDVRVEFDHFASRKVAFCRHVQAFIVFPGGFGTLDELSEILTLIQCGKSPEAPVLLFDTAFWHGLVAWMRERLQGEGLVSATDLDRLYFCDRPRDVEAVLVHGEKRLLRAA